VRAGKALDVTMAAIDDGLSSYRAQALSEAKALPFASMTRTSLDFHLSLLTNIASISDRA